MHAKNHISLTRKTLYGIMLIAVFVAAFGGGGVPAVHAQAGSPEPPVPEATVTSPSIPETIIIEDQTETSVLTATGTAAEDLKSYTDPKYSYSLLYPADWSVEPTIALGYGGIATFSNGESKIEFGVMGGGKQ